METLSYWLARLEPLIRAETEGEIIVVLANRCGSEGEATYAGTSAILGIHAGEVKVYGILGRGERELLVVDTNLRPQAKLISEPNSTVSEGVPEVPKPTESSQPAEKSDKSSEKSDKADKSDKSSERSDRKDKTERSDRKEKREKSAHRDRREPSAHRDRRERSTQRDRSTHRDKAARIEQKEVVERNDEKSKVAKPKTESTDSRNSDASAYSASSAKTTSTTSTGLSLNTKQSIFEPPTPDAMDLTMADIVTPLSPVDPKTPNLYFGAGPHGMMSNVETKKETLQSTIQRPQVVDVEVVMTDSPTLSRQEQPQPSYPSRTSSRTGYRHMHNKSTAPTPIDDVEMAEFCVRPPSPKSRNCSRTRHREYQDPALISHDLAKEPQITSRPTGVVKSPPHSASAVPDHYQQNIEEHGINSPRRKHSLPRPKSMHW